MIIEKFTKLDEPKRKAVTVLTVLVVVCICYFAITRDSVTKLKAANAENAGILAIHADTEHQQTEFSNLQKQIENKTSEFQEYQRQYFSSSKAVQFFENINTMALAYNLKPVSRIISKPKKLSVNKADEEKPNSQQQFFKTQSAKIAVSGNYFNIVDFVNEITNCPQKICITNLHIALAAGENFNPKASFETIFIIDQSEDIEK